MKKVISVVLLLSVFFLAPKLALAASCSPATITAGDIKDTDGFLDSPILRSTGALFDFAAKDGPMGVADAQSTFQYIGVNGVSGPYIFSNGNRDYSIDREAAVFSSVSSGTGSGGSRISLHYGSVSTANLGETYIPQAIQAHLLFGYFIAIEKSQIDNYSSGQVTGTLYLAQTYLTSMPTEQIITGSGTFWTKIRAIAGDNPTDGIWYGEPFAAENRVSCSISLSEDISKDLADAKKAGKMKENDVSNVLNGTDAEESVCGKPTLKNIINFALCSVLDALVTFLRALL